MTSPIDQTLQQHLALLHSVLDQTGSFIYAKDIQGRYIYANQAVLDLFGKESHEVIGFDDSHFFDLSVSAQLKENDHKVLTENIIVEKEEQNFVLHSQQSWFFRSRKTPLVDSDGQVIGLCGISHDITQEKELESLVKDQSQLLDIILNNVDAHIYMKDEQRRFRYVNCKTAESLGKSVEEITNQKDTEILPLDIAEHFYQSDKQVFETNQKVVIEESVLNMQGNERHYISTKIPMSLSDKERVLIGFSTDVTELYQLKEQFKKQANTDPLTKLYNRRYFIEHAEREFSRAQRSEEPLSIISLDLDYFKKVNDQYGHLAGDKVLKQVAEQLQSLSRQEDVLARIGGEEFSMLLINTSPQDALIAAERICSEQANHLIEIDTETTINVRVSVGVATRMSCDLTFEQLFRRSDNALYQAKSQGRSRVIFGTK